MPPIYVKGGVWTNVEDEILKAAVSKYGLNQWLRVASLLPRKSSKQAKARWNEWINPNIDKTSWSKEEDEKLLNLVKLLPNQWRTIAPILNRTATHCVERYQKLLDEAAGTIMADDEENLGLAGAGIESLPATGASKVGDLNINPESKPARPDEDDMNDEEREMLSEAKARLANTQGKKAKRKARERMLEESRRIALLQKRREMKAAGISVSLESKNKKRRKEFDYNADIPHEHAPLAGLYDVSEENDRNDLDKVKFTKEIARDGMNLKEVDDKHKKDKKVDLKQLEEQSKKHKLGLESAVEILHEVEQENLKKRKLDLPAAETVKPHTTGDVEDSLLKGVFDKTEVVTVEDVDERINQKSKEIAATQAIRSALLVDDKSHENDKYVHKVEDPKAVAKAQKSVKAALKKSITEFLKQSFDSLPKPRAVSDLILPSFDASEEPVNLGLQKEPEHFDQGERLRNLEILRQVEEEKAKLRRSQVIQKGLPVPNPTRLRKVTVELDLERSILEEAQALIRSDYRKYEDASYKAKLLEDLDDETLDKVSAEIEAAKAIKPQDSTVSSYKLPQSFDVAESIIGKLHDLYKVSVESMQKIQQSAHTKEYETQRRQLQQEITDIYNQLYEADHNLLLAQHLASQEEIAIDMRTRRLKEWVDEVTDAEHRLEKRVRQLRTN